jgi:hypothetical protein
MDSGVLTGGRRSKQLLSAIHTISRRRPPTYARNGASELLTLVEEPYAEVGEAHRRLRELRSAFESRNDRRAVFLSIYTEMTGAVADRIQQRRFDDPGWVGEYLVAFANLYRKAVRDYEAGDLSSLADPWQLAFEAAGNGDSLVLQDALLGVNAHINYDLALAVDEVGVRPDSHTKYDDHSRITDIISTVINDAQDLLVEYGSDTIGPIDESLGQLDERLMLMTIDECRDSAWRTAVALSSGPRTRRRLAAWINDVTSTGAAYIILSTKASDQLQGVLSDVEWTPDR